MASPDRIALAADARSPVRAMMLRLGDAVTCSTRAREVSGVHVGCDVAGGWGAVWRRRACGGGARAGARRGDEGGGCCSVRGGGWWWGRRLCSNEATPGPAVHWFYKRKTTRLISCHVC